MQSIMSFAFSRRRHLHRQRWAHFGLYLAAFIAISILEPVSAFIGKSQHAYRNRARPLSMVVGKTGSTVIKSQEQYEKIVLKSDSKRPILIFWTAPWCGPCRLSAPVVKDVMKEFAGDIDVCEICTDDLPEVASEAGVVSIPTIQIVYNNALLDTIIGCVAKSVLASAVEKVLEDVAMQKPGASPDS